MNPVLLALSSVAVLCQPSVIKIKERLSSDLTLGDPFPPVIIKSLRVSNLDFPCSLTSTRLDAYVQTYFFLLFSCVGI